MVEIFNDIRKIYQFNRPCDGLADYIEFFSESSAQATVECIGNTCFTVKLFQSWTPTFWINLGPCYQLSSPSGIQLMRPDDDVLVTRNALIERINLPTDHIFTVKFFPGGLEAVLGLSQSKLNSQAIDLNTILPSTLLRCIKKMDSFDERKKAMEDYFMVRLKKRKCQDHYLRFVKDTIASFETTGMCYNVDQLSARSFTSSKTLNRYFHRVVGVGPQQFFSVLRARISLTAYLTDKASFKPVDYGYYDMSHFYKGITKFTGKALARNFQ